MGKGVKLIQKLKNILFQMPRRYRFIIGLIMLMVLAFYFSLPQPLFEVSYSAIIYDRNNNLLGASIARDGQWRFPLGDSIPEKFEHSIMQFEDAWFYQHPGVNPVSMARAAYQNIEAGKIVSGGSTLTMQVIRLSRREPRTVWEKLVEMWLALRLEFRYSKSEILQLYAAHAPFGGNVVGLDAAAWRYYGRSPHQLSWAESATLAVLPNSPSLIFPGKNQEKLLKKRNRLLKKLYHEEVIDSLTFALALEEPLPGPPKALPNEAFHVLQRAQKTGYSGQIVHTTIDPVIQEQAKTALGHYRSILKSNEVHNAALVVVEVESGEALAYHGNLPETGLEHSEMVDIIHRPRSTGSILKPFLYAAMLDEGLLMPEELIADVPILINGFAPKNFSQKYEGAVPANAALARSLNVPAVKMLQRFTYEKFHHLTGQLKLTSIDQPADHYGLSIVLGGAEANLWELTAAYAGMARTLKHFDEWKGDYRYSKADYHENTFVSGRNKVSRTEDKQSYLSASAIWGTFEAMLDVSRPESESSWELFSSARKVAWKTGTSYGFRDAWAIGVTPEFVVGVWVGNADGEGRPGLTGLQAAAPILFDVFERLPATKWFVAPIAEMNEITICSQSGLRAGQYCAETKAEVLPQSCLRAGICRYCQIVHLDASKKYRVNSHCYPVADMESASMMVLPPVMAWYYRQAHSFYKPMPVWLPGCENLDDISPIDFIYPASNAKVYIPNELDGEKGEVLFEVAHQKPRSTLYWHLDGLYLGATERYHQMPVRCGAGCHEVVVLDQEGHQLIRSFEVINE
jgi:penicillin-binding protein 1C